MSSLSIPSITTYRKFILISSFITPVIRQSSNLSISQLRITWLPSFTIGFVDHYRTSARFIGLSAFKIHIQSFSAKLVQWKSARKSSWARMSSLAKNLNLSKKSFLAKKVEFGLKSRVRLKSRAPLESRVGLF